MLDVQQDRVKRKLLHSIMGKPCLTDTHALQTVFFCALLLAPTVARALSSICSDTPLGKMGLGWFSTWSHSIRRANTCTCAVVCGHVLCKCAAASNPLQPAQPPPPRPLLPVKTWQLQQEPLPRPQQQRRQLFCTMVACSGHLSAPISACNSCNSTNFCV